MRTIHKYKLVVADEQDVLMPQNAKILRIAKQNNEIFAWAVVSAGQPMVLRKIFCRGTGNEIPWWPEYIGTIDDEPFVWHFFDAGNCP